MPANTLLWHFFKPRYAMLCVWLIMGCLFILLCQTYAQLSLKSEITQILQQQLPARLQSALYYGSNDGPVIQLIQHNIDADLSSLNTSSVLPLFRQCHARVIKLMSGDASQTGFRLINIQWMLGSTAMNTLLTFNCDTHWLPAIWYPLGFASLLLLLWYLLPPPLNPQQQKIFQQLQQHMPFYRAHRSARHVSHYKATQTYLFEHLFKARPLNQEIRALLAWLEQPQVQQLSEQQLVWFMLASQQHQLSKEQALEVALAPATLCFTAQQGQLIIHGLRLNLAKTPYFYYLWYACLRCQHEGWHLNPPVNRSDKNNAAVLIDLMQNSGGHNKAINDLLAYGLRAKTLDQNRNKLKAELISLLGETLAQDYLFDTERDLKSGRYRYRLSLSPSLIKLPPTYSKTQAIDIQTN